MSDENIREKIEKALVASKQLEQKAGAIAQLAKKQESSAAKNEERVRKHQENSAKKAELAQKYLSVLEERERLRNLVQWALIDKNDKPIVHTSNTLALLQYHGIVVKYNEMTREIEITGIGDTIVADVRMNVIMTQIRDLAAEVSYKISPDVLYSHVQAIAGDNVYHPVRVWIDSREWDGVDRFEQLAATLHTSNAHAPMMLRKWVVSGCALLYRNSVAAHGVLTLIGEQGRGKTSWFRHLVNVPASVGSEKSLNVHDKDSVLDVTSTFITELSEIGGTFKKSDVNVLRAFLTRSYDVIRPPYERTSSKYNRKTIFCGSVNSSRFLVDQEGNRRFWVIETDSVDYEHDVDVQQVWAQGKHLLNQGASWWLEWDELQSVNALNTEHEVIDPVIDLLRAYVHHPDEVEGVHHAPERRCATDILMAIGVSHPTRAQATLAVKWLKDNGYKFYRDTYQFSVVVVKGPGPWVRHSNEV